MKTLSVAVLAVLVLSPLALGQTGHVGRWLGPCTNADVEDAALPTSACGPTQSQVPTYAAGGPCFGVPNFPYGGHGLDQLHDLVYTCDGFTIHVSAYPGALGYSANPCTGPFPGTSFAAPTPVTSAGSLFGPVTGMCVGLGSFPGSPSFPCPDLLFLTDGQWVLGMDPRPPYAVVIPPWFATGLFPGMFLTGLEYDDLSATIVACDWAGDSYEYTTTGTPASTPIFAPTPLLIVGNVLDRSACPRKIWVTDGNVLIPVGGGNPVFLNPPAGSIPFGASFSAEPQLMRGVCASTCFPNPVIGTTEPIASGSTATKSVSFTLTGAPPSTFALFAFDFQCFGFGLPPTCIWWLSTNFNWFYFYTGFTSGSGTLATPALFLPPAGCPGLVGLVGYGQWFYFDSCSSAGFGITDALHCRYSSL